MEVKVNKSKVIELIKYYYSEYEGLVVKPKFVYNYLDEENGYYSVVVPIKLDIGFMYAESDYELPKEVLTKIFSTCLSNEFTLDGFEVKTVDVVDDVDLQEYKEPEFVLYLTDKLANTRKLSAANLKRAKDNW